MGLLLTHLIQGLHPFHAWLCVFFALCNQCSRVHNESLLNEAVFRCTSFYRSDSSFSPPRLLRSPETGSPALPVLSYRVDPPRNQCRTALRDASPKKSSLTH